MFPRCSSSFNNLSFLPLPITGVNPEGHETLAIAWHLQASEMGIFQKDEFVNGFSKSGVSDKKDMKKQIGQVSVPLIICMDIVSVSICILSIRWTGCSQSGRCQAV